jgi:hypothetical protein
MQSEIVCLSNLLCQPNGDNDSVNGKFIMPSSVMLDRLGIKLEQYEVLSEKTHGWMNKLSDTLTFD